MSRTILWGVVVLLKLLVFKFVLKKWLRARFLFESVLSFSKLSCCQKTLKSICFLKSWNYCTSAPSNHDLLLNRHLKKCHSFSNYYEWNFIGLSKQSGVLKDVVNNIYSRRCTFSALTVTSNIPSFKTYLAQDTIAFCLQSLISLKVELLFNFCDQGHRFSNGLEP